MLKVKSRVEIESSHIDSTMKKGKQHSKIVMAFGSHDENSVANEDLSWGKIPEVQTTFFFFLKQALLDNFSLILLCGHLHGEH